MHRQGTELLIHSFNLPFPAIVNLQEINNNKILFTCQACASNTVVDVQNHPKTVKPWRVNKNNMQFITYHVITLAFF